MGRWEGCREHVLGSQSKRALTLLVSPPMCSGLWVCAERAPGLLTATLLQPRKVSGQSSEALRASALSGHCELRLLLPPGLVRGRNHLLR